MAVRTSIVWTARPTGLEHAGAFNAVLGALRANGAELAKLLNFGNLWKMDYILQAEA